MKIHLFLLVFLLAVSSIKSQNLKVDSFDVFEIILKKQNPNTDIGIEKSLKQYFGKDSIISVKTINHPGEIHTIVLSYYNSGSIVISFNYSDYSDLILCVAPNSDFKNQGLKWQTKDVQKQIASKNGLFIKLEGTRILLDSARTNILLYGKYKSKDTSLYFNCSIHDLTVEESIGVDFLYPDEWWKNGAVKKYHFKCANDLFLYTCNELGDIVAIDIYKKKTTAANDGYYKYIKSLQLNE